MDCNLNIKFKNAIFDSTGQGPNVSLSTRLNSYCSCRTLFFHYSESCAIQCLMSRLSLAFVGDTLNLPTIPLFDCFYCPMHAVTLTIRRNYLLASHVTETQHYAIPSYLMSVIVNCQ